MVDRDDCAGMMGKPLASVEVSVDKELLTFTFQDGSTAAFRAEGDCCSSTWIEHLTVPDDMAGSVLEAVIEGEPTEEQHPEHECLQTYKTTFRTPKGDIVVEYRNASNGYYGGYLVRVRPC